MKKLGGDPGGSSTSGTIVISINNNSGSNNNKRKIHDIEISEEGLPVPKHACLDNKNHHHHQPLSQIQDTNILDSVMSLSNDSKPDHDVSSSSSVNWSGTTTQDSIYYNSNHHFDYLSPSFDQQPQLDGGDMMTSIPEYYETNHQSQNHGDEDGDLMFFSNAAAAAKEASSTNYVLSSGRWNIINNQGDKSRLSYTTAATNCHLSTPPLQLHRTTLL